MQYMLVVMPACGKRTRAHGADVQTSEGWVERKLDNREKRKILGKREAEVAIEAQTESTGEGVKHASRRGHHKVTRPISVRGSLCWIGPGHHRRKEARCGQVPLKRAQLHQLGTKALGI